MDILCRCPERDNLAIALPPACVPFALSVFLSQNATFTIVQIQNALLFSCVIQFTVCLVRGPAEGIDVKHVGSLRRTILASSALVQEVTEDSDVSRQ